MIKHQIEKYKQKAWISPVVQNHPNMGGGQVTVFSPNANKLAYAQYVSSLPYVKGAYVSFRGQPYPVVKSEIWKVEDIQEIHYMCEYSDLSNGHRKLRPLLLVNRADEKRWASPQDVMIYGCSTEDTF